MMSDFFEKVVRAWTQGDSFARSTLLFALLVFLIGLGVYPLGFIGVIKASDVQLYGPGIVAIAVAIAYAAATYQGVIEQIAQQQQIEKVEEQARANPEKPQLAWDLARIKLESYLDRNLSQVRSIYWLTLIVMAAGFGFILYGLLQAFQAPEKLLPVAYISSASGVIISFIGGSFLLIYRSILAQSKDYVTVLERINAVGMAVQVISNIPDGNSPLKEQTTAELAKQLLGMYGSSHSPVVKPAAKTRVKSRSPKVEPDV
jgi:hypothetical protein